jgi:hypothetical protein
VVEFEGAHRAPEWALWRGRRREGVWGIALLDKYCHIFTWAVTQFLGVNWSWSV